MKERLRKTWKWLRKNVFNKEMFVFVLIAEAIFWSPCIATGLMALIINPWYWGAFGAIIAFWAGPLTPAVPLQIGLAIALKKLWEKLRKTQRGNSTVESVGHNHEVEGSTPSPATKTQDGFLPDSAEGSCEPCEWSSVKDGKLSNHINRRRNGKGKEV